MQNLRMNVYRPNKYTQKVEAARAATAVATGAWVKSKHMYLIRGTELKLCFYPSAGGLKKKKKVYSES